MPHVRVALVDDHALYARGLTRMFATTSDISLVLTVRSVESLHCVPCRHDVVLLDPRVSPGARLHGAADAVERSGAAIVLIGDYRAASVARARSALPHLTFLDKGASAEAITRAIRDAHASRRPGTTPNPTLPVEADSPHSPQDPGLSQREREILAWYAHGHTARAVGEAYGLSPHSVANYLQRIRRKYARAGRAAPTRVDLFHRAHEDLILADVPPVAAPIHHAR